MYSVQLRSILPTIEAAKAAGAGSPSNTGQDQMLMAVNANTKQPLFDVCLPSDHARYQMIAIS